MAYREDELEQKLFYAKHLLAAWADGETHALAITTREFLRNKGPQRAYADHLNQILSNELVTLSKSYALQMLAIRRWAEDEGATVASIDKFMEMLTEQPPAVVVDLMRQAGRWPVGTCERCGDRAPLKPADGHSCEEHVNDPEKSCGLEPCIGCKIVCVWGCSPPPVGGIS